MHLFRMHMCTDRPPRWGDSLDEQTGQMEEKQPFSHFMTHMTRELSSRLPSFCLKTGMATSIPGDDSNCTALVRALESGMPVVSLGFLGA